MLQNVSFRACHAWVISPASSPSACLLIFPNRDVSSLRLSLLPEPDLPASHYCPFCLQSSAAAVQAHHPPPCSISGTINQSPTHPSLAFLLPGVLPPRKPTPRCHRWETPDRKRKSLQKYFQICWFLNYAPCRWMNVSKLWSITSHFANHYWRNTNLSQSKTFPVGLLWFIDQWGWQSKTNSCNPSGRITPLSVLKANRGTGETHWCGF